ncbi:NAD(P)-dependent oxidoreductase [Streptomyces sp. SID3343]|uniref:NAD(P)-dependent oxidoreductase n=1 Tax=Streptomyces sp. SID3343 TaxID=2690260 RepID=UPI00136837CF|nr:NAD(P)-dependent oxidoreductase [Streptomyces sp. SID3343]MYV99867.1 DUF1932 domain-containing protein [Streptomyces sp. SID3343]
MTTVGVLHPGSMGAAVAGELSSRGIAVLWCAAGRSAETRARAAKFNLEAVDGLDELLDRSTHVISLCPPGAAEAVARSVAERRFSGLYVEANAVSPERMERMSALLNEGGAAVVDGGVVGSPPSATRSPWLYLSGARGDVARVTALFADTRVQPKTLPGGIGQASGLKLSYSAYQKASRALAAVAHAMADEYGVGPDLLDIAHHHSARHLADLAYTADVAAKAWRWEAEMREVSSALKTAGLPATMADGAADVLSLWAPAKDANLGPVEAIRQLRTTLSDCPDMAVTSTNAPDSTE